MQVMMLQHENNREEERQRHMELMDERRLKDSREERKHERDMAMHQMMLTQMLCMQKPLQGVQTVPTDYDKAHIQHDTDETNQNRDDKQHDNITFSCLDLISIISKTRRRRYRRRRA